MEKLKRNSVWIAIGIAALLWFAMFSPWTKTLVHNFWIFMAGAAVILTGIALLLGRDWKQRLLPIDWRRQILIGLGIAVALWIVFWIGDKLSQLVFDFARGQVNTIYDMKYGLPQWLIALLLLFVIGPAEEIFWRGYVQHSLHEKFGEIQSFGITVAIYTFIHIWSFNFMLIMSALVCGLIWGGIYLWKPKWLPALVVSHAVWDACVFVIFPI